MLKANYHDQLKSTDDIENASLEKVLLLLLNLKDIHTFEARIWFCFSLFAASLGFLLILIGSLAWLAGFDANGWTASLIGGIPTAISVLFFQQKKLSDRLVEEDIKKIIKLRENELNIQLAVYDRLKLLSYRTGAPRLTSTSSKEY